MSYWDRFAVAAVCINTTLTHRGDTAVIVITAHNICNTILLPTSFIYDNRAVYFIHRDDPALRPDLVMALTVHSPLCPHHACLLDRLLWPTCTFMDRRDVAESQVDLSAHGVLMFLVVETMKD